MSGGRGRPSRVVDAIWLDGMEVVGGGGGWRRWVEVGEVGREVMPLMRMRLSSADGDAIIREDKTVTLTL